MMPYLNLSGDENVDNSLRLSIEGGEYAYKLIKFLQKHKLSDNSTLKDALSMYRGGTYDKTKAKELSELISQLNGDEKVERPFVFLGNNSDLSYFWRLENQGKHAQLSLAELSTITDVEARKRTATTMARCYIDGLLNLDTATQTYSLTKKGEEHIYKGDFVQNRLLKEVAFFTKSEIALQEQADAISKRMVERGFEGYNRVTVDRHSLGAVENQDGMFCRIPNTKGQDYICFKNGTFFGLTEKTTEVYIAPQEQYNVLDAVGNVKRKVSGTELSKFYELKNTQSKKLSTFEESVKTEHVEGASYQANDYVFAVNMYEEGVELNQYRVSYAIEDKATGDIIYKLSPTTPGNAEIIQTEHCVGKTMFSSRAEGKAVLSTEKGKAAAEAIKATFTKSQTATPVISSAPKFDLYTAAASAAYQSAEKIVRSIVK